MSTPDQSPARHAPASPPALARAPGDRGHAAHHGLRCPSLPPGSIIKSLLTTMCGGALLLAAAAVLDPATLQAGSSLPLPPTEVRQAERASALRDIESLFNSARQVLDIRPARDDRGCEVVLWLNDARDPNRLNDDEIALLRHSPLFQTLTLYTASPTSPQRGGRAASNAQPIVLTPADLAAPGFIDRWRAASSVQAKVLATRISGLHIESVSERATNDSRATTAQVPQPAALSPLRVHLTCAGDSVDGAFQAQAVVFTSPVPAFEAPGTPQEHTP